MEIWTDMQLTMPTDKDYCVMETIAKNYFDDQDHWPVEEYDPDSRTIKIESVLATQDDAIEFASEMLEKIISSLAESASGSMRDAIESLSYTLHGHTDEGGYTECDFVIERNGNSLTMKESSFSNEDAFDDEDSYEKWCDHPDYGPVIDLKKKRDKAKEVGSMNEMIAAYLEDKGLPHDETAVDQLSVEDVYAIMAGTYGGESAQCDAEEDKEEQAIATCEFELRMTVRSSLEELKNMLRVFTKYDAENNSVYFTDVEIDYSEGDSEVTAKGPCGQFGALNDIGIFREMAEAVPEGCFTAEIKGFTDCAAQSLHCSLENGILHIQTRILRGEDGEETEEEMDYDPRNKRYLGGGAPMENRTEEDEITTEAFLELLRRNGKNGSLQQIAIDAQGNRSVTDIYGNASGVSDGLDRSVNIFCSKACLGVFLNGVLEDRFQSQEKMDSYVMTIDLTDLAGTIVITRTEEKITFQLYSRDERKSNAPHCKVNEAEWETPDGSMTVSMEQLEESTHLMWVIAAHGMRRYLSQEGLLARLKELDNRGSGVVISVDGDAIDAKLVRGRARPELPCQTLFGEMMCRPYPDEQMTELMMSVMSEEDRIAEAESGDPDCMVSLAMDYLNGDGVPQNFEKSAHWWEKLAEMDDAMAQYNLGLYYAKGCGVPRDFSKAAMWMKKAADNGDPDAANFVEMYADAAATLQKAEAGDAEAQAKAATLFTHLGGSLDPYTEGNDYRTAFDWAQKSAAQGNKEGCYCLALCYERGRGTDVQMSKAVEAYEKAAQQGHAPAQWNLAVCYMQGKGVEEDEAKGLRWAYLSADQNYEYAVNGLTYQRKMVHQIVEGFSDPEFGVTLEGTQYEGRAGRCESLRAGMELQYRIVKDKRDRDALECFYRGGSVGLIDGSWMMQSLIVLLKMERVELTVRVKSCTPKSQRGPRARNALVCVGFEVRSIVPDKQTASLPQETAQETAEPERNLVCAREQSGSADYAEQQPLAAFSYSEKNTVETEYYTVLIPDGFRYRKDANGQDFSAWLPTASGDKEETAGIRLYSSQKEMPHSSSTELLTPEMCEAAIGVNYWSYPIRTRCKNSKYIPLNQGYPAGGVMAGYDDNCFYYHALFYFSDHVKLFIAQFSDVTPADVARCDELVVSWLRTMRMNKPFQQLRSLTDPYFIDCVVQKEQILEWQITAAAKHSIVQHLLNYAVEKRSNQARALLPTGEDTAEAINADGQVLLDQTTARQSACLKELVEALELFKQHGASEAVLRKLLQGVSSETFRDDRLELSFDGGKTKITSEIPGNPGYRRRYEALIAELDTAEADRKQEEEQRLQAEREEQEKRRQLAAQREAERQEVCGAVIAQRLAYYDKVIGEIKRQLEAKEKETYDEKRARVCEYLERYQAEKRMAEEKLKKLGLFSFGEKKTLNSRIARCSEKIAEAETKLQTMEDTYQKACAEIQRQIVQKKSQVMEIVIKKYPMPSSAVAADAKTDVIRCGQDQVLRAIGSMRMCTEEELLEQTGFDQELLAMVLQGLPGGIAVNGRIYYDAACFPENLWACLEQIPEYDHPRFAELPEQTRERMKKYYKALSENEAPMGADDLTEKTKQSFYRLEMVRMQKLGLLVAEKANKTADYSVFVHPLEIGVRMDEASKQSVIPTEEDLRTAILSYMELHAERRFDVQTLIQKVPGLEEAGVTPKDMYNHLTYYLKMAIIFREEQFGKYYYYFSWDID